MLTELRASSYYPVISMLYIVVQVITSILLIYSGGEIVEPFILYLIVGILGLILLLVILNLLVQLIEVLEDVTAVNTKELESIREEYKVHE